MKQCPLCGSTFDDKVDFCFEDGSPLEKVADVDDPTALPSPAKGIPLAAAVTEIKPRRARRGMFGRPSVADMLDVSGPGAAPPSGGVRVAEGKPLDEMPTVLAEPPLEDAVTVIEEPDSTATAVVAMPGADLLKADTLLDEPEEVVPSQAEEPLPPPSISVPVSPLAVDVPDASIPAEPTDAPPGLEVPEPSASLDDSWFGDESSFGVEPAADSDPVDSFGEELPRAEDVASTGGFDAAPKDDAGDAGFADASAVPGFEDDGAGVPGFDDDIGFADDAVWNEVSTTQSQPIPKAMVIGGVIVLAAAVLLTVVLSGDEEVAASPQPTGTAVVVDAQPAPPPPVASNQPPAEVVEEPLPDDAMADEEGVVPEVEEAEVAVELGEPSAPSSARTPPAKKPAPVPSGSAKTAKSSKAAKRSKAKQKANKKDPVSVWTGAPAASTAPAAAPDANPWGAPVEAPSIGRLTITTEPSEAMVYVDGRRVGRSPTETEVTFGTHKVRVEKKSFKGNSRVVNVQSAQVNVPFRLDPEQVSGNCNLLPMGNLSGAVVVMDGKNVGALPLTVPCTPGSHKFKVTPQDGAAFTTSRAVSFSAQGETATIFLSP